MQLRAADAREGSVADAPTPRPAVIRIVDAETKRPLPLVELRTTHDRVFVTDNAGVVAVDDPELIGRETWFHVRAHGYEHPKDGFGSRGFRIPLTPGSNNVRLLPRVNLAERIARLTGAGLFGESQRAGLPVPERFRTTPGGVFGCDSVQTARLGDRRLWIWGDTNRISYPLGNFQTTGAWTSAEAVPPNEPVGPIPFGYLEDGKGFVRGVAPIPGEGPTWLHGLTPVVDESGQERLLALYLKVKPPLTVYRRGICEWDPASGSFRHVRDVPMNLVTWPEGAHSFRFKDADGEWIGFAEPFLRFRCRPTRAGFLAIEAWESFADLGDAPIPSSSPAAGSSPSKVPAKDARGARFGWKQGAAPTLRPDLPHPFGPAPWTSRLPPTQDAAGKRVSLHRGSIRWNDYRKKWVMIANEEFGKPSNLGEVWYLEAPHPTGPWSPAVKIVTHDGYSFYNPCHHEFLDRDGGRLIHFEGTYTTLFANVAAPTPRYDYNQILYRLDLANPKLRVATDESRFVDWSASGGLLRLEDR